MAEILYDDRQMMAQALDAMMATLLRRISEINELRARNDRLEAIVAEVRRLEAIDHGVAWPDLCHALYELAAVKAHPAEDQ